MALGALEAGLDALYPALQDSQVGECQLSLHILGVPLGVHAALGVGHRWVLEGTHHVEKRVRTLEQVQELATHPGVVTPRRKWARPST